MKRLTLFIALVATTLLAHAQTTDSAFNRRLTEFMQASKDLEIDKIMDYVYPRIFELVPKEKMAEQMKETLNSDVMKITMGVPKILDVEDFTTVAGTSFTRFKYDGIISVQIIPKDSTENDDTLYLGVFKAQFGQENVTYEAATHTIHIRALKYSLAIKDSYTKNLWTFINQEESKIFKNILPEAVVKKYKM